MLFRKKIARDCTYCSYATILNEREALCVKKGVVDCVKACRKFRYDPCKRVPPKTKAMDFQQYAREDFDL
ncbi:MAG: hypothetical protein IJZ48_04145 [Oscillospiraceae bacterium]|nr:hypothetical protein [Oscillospiraceae bacterium]